MRLFGLFAAAVLTLSAPVTAARADGIFSALMFEPGEIAHFDGPYAGVQWGGMHNFVPHYNYFPEEGNGLHPSRFINGIFAGANVRLGNGMFVGGEGQLGLNFNTSGDEGWDAWAIARAGIQPLDRVIVYGGAGVGMLQNTVSWTAGGGSEFALTPELGVRFDLYAIGELGPNPNAPSVKGVTAIKASFGGIWHIN